MLIDGRGINPTCRRLGEVLGGYKPLIPIQYIKNSKKNFKNFKNLHMSIFLLTFAPLNREVLSLYHP
jgi:hypothetical protein